MVFLCMVQGDGEPDMTFISKKRDRELQEIILVKNTS